LQTKKTSDGKFLHVGRIESGMVQLGDRVIAKIDIEKRKCTARNHTTTHILHRALKNVLGDHVQQAGSLVTPDRLRFDFTHFSPLTDDQIEAVEQEANSIIMGNYPVVIREMTVEEAKKAGATALFGEKYGDVVRVVSVGNYSMELCGGTHIGSSGEAGLVKIIAENGIASGVRRIEALTGTGAISWYKEKERTLRKVSEIVKSTSEDAPVKVAHLVEEVKNLQKELNSVKEKMMSKSVDSIRDKAEDVSGIKVLAARMDQLDMTALRNMTDTLKNKLGPSVVVLASALDGKVSLVVSATKDAVSRGVHCGKVISEAAKAAGGGGGGRPDMAQAGGKDINGIDKAMDIAVNIIKEQLI